jgi:hypothetical protein
VTRFSHRAQLALETFVLVVCAALVVAFYAALVALVLAVWMGRNEVTVRIAITVFALAWFWPIAHALIWRRARRNAALTIAAPMVPFRPVSADAPGREIDLTAPERQREAAPATRVDARDRGRAAPV